MENLQISYEMHDDYLKLNLEGKLSLMDALELKKILPAKIENYNRVKIDLNLVSSMDLTGFNALLMTKKKMKNKIFEILAAKDHPFHEFIYLTKFADQFVIHN